MLADRNSQDIAYRYILAWPGNSLAIAAQMALANQFSSERASAGETQTAQQAVNTHRGWLWLFKRQAGCLAYQISKSRKGIACTRRFRTFRFAAFAVCILHTAALF